MKTVDVLQRSTIRKLNTLAKQESRKGLLSIPLCVSPSLRENRKTPIAGT